MAAAKRGAHVDSRACLGRPRWIRIGGDTLTSEESGGDEPSRRSDDGLRTGQDGYLPKGIAWSEGGGATRMKRLQRANAVRGGAAALALMLLVLTGCGEQGGDAAAEPRRDRSSSVSPDPSRSPASERSETDGDAFGVDRVEWPGDLEAAKVLLDGMPTELAGEVRHRPRFFGSAAGVMYGRGDAAPTAWVMQADADVPDAPSALAVMFGMTMACKKDSYRGTAPQSRFGGGPDLDLSGDYNPDEGSWWFACIIDGAEGAPGFTGYALGWASGDLGWLTVAPDRGTSRDLVKALLQAAD